MDARWSRDRALDIVRVIQLHVRACTLRQQRRGSPVVLRIMTTDVTRISDDALLAAATCAAATERRATAELLTLLIEVERRQLHLQLGHSSLFVFCTHTLRFSEQAAYSRITAARAARRFPEILTRLSDGVLSLSSVGLLAPHLTEETAEAMLEAAAGKSTREVERLIASWHPQPDVPSMLRALPTSKTPAPGVVPPSEPRVEPTLEPVTQPTAVLAAAKTASAAVPCAASMTAPRTVIAPIAPRRYVLKLTIDQDTYDQLERARALLRHTIPDGDPAAILNRALEVLLDQLARTKYARASKPRRAASPVGNGRHIPAAVKREVWQRDGGRCLFTGADGQCGETAFLEFHHVVPFANGGPTSAGNLELRCRAHNQYEAVAHQRWQQTELWT